MKNNLIKSLLIVFSMISITSCDPGSVSFHYDTLKENIKEIKLIDYHNENQKHFISWVPNHEDELQNFDLNNYSVIEIMESEKHDSFAYSLSQKDILYKYYAYDSPKGISIMITFTNDDFEIINCTQESYAGYIGRYNSNGENVEFLGCFSSYYYYEELINDYFNYQI